MNRTTCFVIVILVVSAVILLMTKLFFLDMIVVRGTSMEPTLKGGTLIFINKLAFGPSDPLSGAALFRWGGPARGDIVIFRDPQDDSIAVKRCLAVAGDTLAVADKYLVFNGRRLPLSFFQENMLRPDYTVPPGSVFLVGDNPAHSADSRTYGAVPIERLLGAMLFPPQAAAEDAP